ncbi:putative s-formylglutathione hydrolase [Collimonas fungivorans]|uniref:S-formylglutathione hydrolase n=1 Tax=Collimonas fungivorans TaxID=158899 RepID=A0A127PD67_9BURK|nr:putative s-formylglutathione hydrolase [Collimonas fungivorans]
MLGLPQPFPQEILIDQGLGDKFLAEQLLPAQFEAACAQAGQRLTLRRHADYDHGYYFISTLIEDHLAFHQRILSANS